MHAEYCRSVTMQTCSALRHRKSACLFSRLIDALPAGCDFSHAPTPFCSKLLSQSRQGRGRGGQRWRSSRIWSSSEESSPSLSSIFLLFYSVRIHIHSSIFIVKRARAGPRAASVSSWQHHRKHQSPCSRSCHTGSMGTTYLRPSSLPSSGQLPSLPFSCKVQRPPPWLEGHSLRLLRGYWLQRQPRWWWYREGEGPSIQPISNLRQLRFLVLKEHKFTLLLPILLPTRLEETKHGHSLWQSCSSSPSGCISSSYPLFSHEPSHREDGALASISLAPPRRHHLQCA